MQMRLCILPLFFYCAALQACEKETMSEFRIRVQESKEKSKKWYAENRWFKQTVVLKKLGLNRSLEENETPVVFAKPINDDILEE